ncbi:MAG: hypothetical protein P8L85_12555 [Rubripirellula sp.]|nr:hypothetical protein [Rubripirellula sp.]
MLGLAYHERLALKKRGNRRGNTQNRLLFGPESSFAASVSMDRRRRLDGSPPAGGNTIPGKQGRSAETGGVKIERLGTASGLAHELANRVKMHWQLEFWPPEHYAIPKKEFGNFLRN